MILELKGIFKNYQQGKMSVPVLKDVNFSMEEGEYVAIMGPSGSGKTTLMNIIGCLDKPTEGKFFLDGQDILNCSENDMSDIRLNKIGFVFQSFFLMMKQTALENVCLPLTYAGIPKRKRKEIAAQALKRVGLEDRMNYKPTQLSGGQCQRVAIARAISNHPKILLADEPTGALDSKSTDELLGVFERINQSGQTILMVTHHMEEVILADRIIVMDQGKIVMDGKPKEIFSRVDEMKTLGLEVPYATELAWELKKEGVNLSDTITTKEELVEELCQFV